MENLNTQSMRSNRRTGVQAYRLFSIQEAIELISEETKILSEANCQFIKALDSPQRNVVSKIDASIKMLNGLKNLK